MSYIRLLILIMLISSVECCFAQQEIPISLPENLNTRSLNIGDSSFMLIGNCKNVGFIFFTKGRYEEKKLQSVIAIAIPEKEKSPLFKIQGNILYSFNYRSYIDTPFAESNVMQHLVQTNFNLLVKDKYPVKVIVSNRSSNSPYFKNATDVKLEFNRYQLLDNIKADLRKKAFSAANLSPIFRKRRFQSRVLLIYDGTFRIEPWWDCC